MAGTLSGRRGSRGALALRRLSFIAALILCAAAPAGGKDLYHVTLTGPTDAEALRGLGLDAVARVADGYLVLIDPPQAAALETSALRSRLVRANIARSDLARDLRTDPGDRARYPVVFESGGLRLVDVRGGIVPDENGWLGLAPLPSTSLPIVCRTARPIGRARPERALDLDSLISLINEDSCRSYVERLQAFGTRKVGTSQNAASRDWLVDKFRSFGYDSVITDSFAAYENWGDGPAVAAFNVIAVKPGTLYPDFHILIGAHRDSSPRQSPGADDDASGIAGVLEIARVAAALETPVSLVFAAFDAEECGLWGSDYYAAEAARREDSIALVLNMDMIGYHENDSAVWVYHTVPGSYGALWGALADSLAGVDLSAHLAAGAAWDAEPFEQRGYEALTLHEYVRMPFVHTARDSAVYINFDYLARVVRGTLATTLVAAETFAPGLLRFALPGPLADPLPAGRPIELEVYLRAAGSGCPAAGGARLHYSFGEGAWDSLSMAESGADRYRAELPPVYEMTPLHFYFTATDTSGSVFAYHDREAPFLAVVAARSEVVFRDDFNQDCGWQVMGGATEGVWERVLPQSAAFWGAPGRDYDNSGYCFLTGNATVEDVDGGTTMLVSPWIAVGAGEARIRYARWFADYYPEGEPYSDTFRVYVRPSPSQSFRLVETVGPVVQADGGWYAREFMAGEIVATTGALQLRFDASDAGADSHVEAAVDDITVWRYTCDPAVLTASLPDWTAGVPYSCSLAAAACCSLLVWTDKNDALAGSGLVLEPSGALSGVPLAAQAINLTAQAVDDSGRVGERTFPFTINPVLEVATDWLPRGMVGAAYSRRLEAEGGTGGRVWRDRDLDLAGSGLALDSSGLLSGTPVAAGGYSFVAEVVDQVGARAVRELAVAVDESYVCGDVSGDGVGPNIQDLSFLVSFLFRGGPPPPVPAAANVDGAGAPGADITVADLTYLVAYMFRSGSAPICAGPSAR
ncbi:MAG TPA: M28 family peptidase [candidate division Zixibacteria bacterium]|nr:M28 family peptidase [candidate division Zixibacteria bacterium]MDD4917344.1 M28 family peptidase [candidate division Zixibacteria bacterium]MDM7971902.1 M28 family peptidase [candidate division Zixibacteria bacterium]HOD66953.1 M28 family peptidase [candidate division Zixibacteria bacterium]